MRADVGDPTVRAGFDVGAAIERAFPGLSLECLEERVAFLHPERRRDLFLQPRCDIVILQEERRFDLVLMEPRFYQDAEYEGPAKGIVHEAILQGHRGDRFALPPPLAWGWLSAFVLGYWVVIVFFVDFGDGEIGRWGEGRGYGRSDRKGWSWRRVRRLTQAEPQRRIRRVFGAVALAQTLQYTNGRTHDSVCAQAWRVIQFSCIRRRARLRMCPEVALVRALRG